MNPATSEFKLQALLLELLCLTSLLVNLLSCATKTCLQSTSEIRETSESNIHKSAIKGKSVYDFLRVYCNDAVRYWGYTRVC